MEFVIMKNSQYMSNKKGDRWRSTDWTEEKKEKERMREWEGERDKQTLMATLRIENMCNE